MGILTRRNFLHGAVGLAGAALLAACGASNATAVPTSGAATGGAASSTAPGTTVAAASSSPVAAATRRASGSVRYLLRAGSADETKLTQDFLDKNFTPQSGVKVPVEPTDATRTRS